MKAEKMIIVLRNEQQKGIHKACKLMKASASLMTFPSISCCCYVDGEKLKNHHHHDTFPFHPLKVMSSCCVFLPVKKIIFQQEKRKVKMLWAEGNFTAESFCWISFQLNRKCLLVLTLHERASCTTTWTSFFVELQLQWNFPSKSIRFLFYQSFFLYTESATR